MLAENIKIGDRIRITRKEDDIRGKAFISQVEEVLDNNIVIGLVPVSYGHLIKLPTGNIYTFLFFTDVGMLRFDAMILELFKDDNISLMKFRLISEGEKMQRRDFFRFSCMLPMKFSVIDDAPDMAEAEDTAESSMYDGIIKDIGGGGVRFVSNVSLEESVKIKCLILLDDNYFIVVGKVLYMQHFPKSTYKYQYRTAFVDILPSEQDRIIHYIFTEQRKLLSKTNL